MSTKAIIKEFKKGLKKIYGNRLKKVILYGSWARDAATEDSDIDLMVVLKGPVSPGKEIDRMIDCITDLNLKYDTLISVIPVSQEMYAGTQSPLLLNVRREGLAV